MSPALEVGTTIRGNVNGDEALNVLDVSAEVDVLKAVTGHLPKYKAQVEPNDPDPMAAMNVLGVSNVVDSVKGGTYPFSGPMPCP